MCKLALATSLLLVIFGISASSCADSKQITISSLTQSKSLIQSKASSELLMQISLRQVQLASPTPERLVEMQAQGMNIINIGIQRVYIYLEQQLTPAQTSELQGLGITVYLDSWLPPAGNNPNGFYLADVPVNKLDSLAAKNYVVRLDTAEKLLQPQSDLPKGG